MIKRSLFVVLGLIVFCCVQLAARDITTIDGFVYKNVKVVKSTPAGIIIKFPGNPAEVHVGFEFLPDNIRKEFNYSPDRAKKYLEAYRPATSPAPAPSSIKPASTPTDTRDQFKKYGRIYIYSDKSDTQFTIWKSTQTRTFSYGDLCVVIGIGKDALLMDKNGGVYMPTKEINYNFHQYLTPINTFIANLRGQIAEAATEVEKLRNAIPLLKRALYRNLHLLAKLTDRTVSSLMTSNGKLKFNPVYVKGADAEKMKKIRALYSAIKDMLKKIPQLEEELKNIEASLKKKTVLLGNIERSYAAFERWRYNGK